MRSAASTLSYVFLALLYARIASAAYFPLREYAGATFFDRFQFTDGIDDKTWGNATFLGQAAANSSQLISLNSAGNVIIKVDDTTTIAPAELVHRNTVRIVSADAYPVGTIIVADFVHMPFGCSVWSSYWLLGDGPEWPNVGEIDIVEGINMYTKNQFSMHTTTGCTQPQDVQQVGNTHTTDCLSVSGTDKNGCITEETKPNSYGAGFAQAGGGVYAVQMDVSGVFMWFWSRPDVPKSISGSTSTSSMDLTDWGKPSAAYPASSCNITQFFQPQNIIMDITLCGLFAGALYSQTCPGECVKDNIIGNGSNYKDAYFEIKYIRTYSATQQDNAASQSASGNVPAASGGSSGGDSKTSSDSNSTNPDTNAKGTSVASSIASSWTWALGAALVAAFAL